MRIAVDRDQSELRADLESLVERTLLDVADRSDRALPELCGPEDGLRFRLARRVQALLHARHEVEAVGSIGERPERGQELGDRVVAELVVRIREVPDDSLGRLLRQRHHVVVERRDPFAHLHEREILLGEPALA
jgi:hypothetical protein